MDAGSTTVQRTNVLTDPNAVYKRCKENKFYHESLNVLFQTKTVNVNMGGNV